MDEARRLDLIARRAASVERARLRAFADDRAAYVRSVPILAALEMANERYDSFGYDRLTGALNWWANAPDRWPMSVQDYTPMPADTAARAGAIIATLHAAAGSADGILVILRSEDMVLALSLSTLERHIALLLRHDLYAAIGFAKSDMSWCVEVTEQGIAVGVLNDDA